MITEKEVTAILKAELPEIKEELNSVKDSDNVYQTMECFVGFTKKVIYKGYLKEAKHYFIIAEKIFSEGNYNVKSALSGIYVCSIGTLVALSALTTKKLKEIFPDPLRNKYCTHFYHKRSGVSH